MTFEAFYRHEHDRVLKTAGMLTGNGTDAWELTQEAFARSLAAWPRVSRMAAPGAWVHTVLVNLARRSWRRRKGEMEAVRASAAPDEAFSVDQHTDTRLLLLDALWDLPNRQREAIVLRYIADLSLNDTATAMKCTTGSVKQHCFRGLDALRKALRFVPPETTIPEMLHAR